MSSNKLYYRKTGFLLSDGTDIFVIDEPIKWDQVTLCIKFDESTVGYRYEFSDKDVVLEFDEAAGLSKIKAQYDAKRVDMNCSLKFGYYEGDVFTVLYEGQLVGQTYEYDGITVKATIEKRSIGQKFNSRYEIKTDLFRADSIDGILITPLDTVDMVMHGVDLRKSASGLYNTNVDPEMDLTLETFGPSNPAFYTAVPPFKMDGNISGISSPTPPDGSFYYAGLELNAGETSRRIKVNVRIDTKYTKTNSGQNIASGFWIYKVPGISLGNNGDLGNMVSGGEYINYTGSDGILAGTFIRSTINTFDFVVLADEALFIKAVVYVADPDGAAPYTISDFEFVNLEEMYLRVEEVTTTQSTINKWTRLFEAVNKQCEIVLDAQNVLKSNVMGRIDLGYASNGTLANKFIDNGKLIRGAPEAKFNLSTKDWVNSLSGLYALGMSIEKDVANKEWVRVEPVEFFFGDQELLRLEEVSRYTLRPALEYVFNELEFGFNKYPQDNQLDSLKDYLTKMSFSTPIKMYKNKMSKLVDFLLSTYYIEYTRQQAFSKNPSNAYETDENTFLIAASEVLPIYEGVDCSFQPDNVITFIDTLVPIVAGDSFTIAGHPVVGNNATYKAASVEIVYNGGLVFTLVTVVESFTEDLSTDPVDVTVVSTNRFTPDRNMLFVGGASAYNPDYTITKSLYRWSRIFTSGLAAYFNNGSIKFMSGFNNISIDNVDHAIPDFDNGDESGLEKPLFSGNVIECEVVIDWNIFKTLIAAFEGRDPDDKNYGYITVVDPDGVDQKGYVMDLTFNPTTQLMKVKLLERYAYA